MTLSQGSKKNKVTTNRGMIRRTFDKRGSDYAAELALQNLNDLKKILHWNKQHDIHFFRISSCVFPWASEYSISNLPSYPLLVKSAELAGEAASNYGMRLTSHPGPFNKLCSPKESVVENTIRDLEIHGEMFDMMGLSRTPYNKINIHVGAAYDSKEVALDTFCRNFERLPKSVQSRLTVENDDRPSLYSTHELYEGIYKRLGIPIVFDYHHHKFRNDGETEEEALRLAASTWGDITPVVHYSESMSEEKNDPTIKANAHSDYIYNAIDDYGLEVDIMIEAKAKELALKKYRNTHNIERK